jgi:hypothetical protein
LSIVSLEEKKLPNLGFHKTLKVQKNVSGVKNLKKGLYLL